MKSSFIGSFILMTRTPAVLDRLYPLLSDRTLVGAARLFKQELAGALASQQSSLPAIVNPVSRSAVAAGKGVAVSIGGTNGYVSAFRVAPSGRVTFGSRRLFSLPQQTTKDALFELIARQIFAVVRREHGPVPIGIGFAYPLQPVLHHGFIDGVLLSMSKGRDIQGLVGKRVGQEFHKFLLEQYQWDTTVALANDAICLLLGGKGADLAGVVGTGVNFAYWEKRTRISAEKMKTVGDFMQKEVAINIESAQFDKLPATILRECVDQASREEQGRALAEKEVAGAFLYQLFNAGKDEIVGKTFPSLQATDQLNDLLTGAFRFPTRISDQQRQQAVAFSQRLFERSAQIVAIEICGILMKIGKTKGMVPVVMEGGIFWKAKNYHSLVNGFINTILPECLPSFARLFGSSRRGIALLALKSV